MPPPQHLYDGGKDDDSDDSGKADGSDDGGNDDDSDNSDKAAEAVVAMAGDLVVDEALADSIIDELRARNAAAAGGMTEWERNNANRAFNELIGKKCQRGTRKRGGRRDQKRTLLEMMTGSGSGSAGSAQRLVNPRAVAGVLRDI